MSKNIVVLAGSPRKGMSTDKLAAAFINGAELAGKTVTIFRVSDMNISGCTGCAYCFKEKGICAIKDDMTEILNAIQKADCIVFASPVYFCSVSGQLKLALDRTTALTGVKMPAKQAALLMTCMDRASAEPAIAMYKTTLPFKKWNDAGIIIASGLSGTNSIDDFEELEQARQLGKEI
jgi:multimeric flavodoxin WrbA